MQSVLNSRLISLVYSLDSFEELVIRILKEKSIRYFVVKKEGTIPK